MEFEKARDYILNRIKTDLPPFLYYHSYNHVLDVVNSVLSLAHLEGVAGEDLTLLQTAVLFHDSGFVIRLQEHEMAGCDIAREKLPEFQYTPDQIERICGMIMATRIPQSPKNKLEEIICDADLDYLGREDFWEIGNNLFRELVHLEIIKTEEEWNKLQFNFLNKHHYFTESSKKNRQSLKLEHLQKIKNIVETYTA